MPLGKYIALRLHPPLIEQDKRARSKPAAAAVPLCTSPEALLTCGNASEFSTPQDLASRLKSMSSNFVTLPDGKRLEFDHQPSGLEVARAIGSGLAKATVGVRLNGSTETLDLRLPIPNGSQVEIVTLQSAAGLEVIRHSAAHVMAQAVQSIWPDVKVTIGPVIDDGFYYDFDSPKPFTPEDFEKIESKMAEIIKKNLPIERTEVATEKAIETFRGMKETFKVELIEDIKAKTGAATVGIYSNGGEWMDLCRGPHVQSTGQIKAFKLMSIAGAYWRGDEKRAQLQRVYATAFNDPKELSQYLTRIEEAKKRDHRKLGKDLGLFLFHPFAPGSPFFTGRGSIVYNELVGLMRDLYLEYGYQEVITPQVFDVELFKTSGHYENYRENMYFAAIDAAAQREKVEGSDSNQTSMKPMNCPAHCLMFGATKHSYRDLPLRIADFGRLHRFERSGVLHGLTRVRTFCQDDAHVFCRKDQLQAEFESFMRMTAKTYEILGMRDFKILVATRPEKRLGTDADWDFAENALMDGLKSLGYQYEISPGEGAFYGPKIEIHFVDAIGRSWQLGTLQIDPNLPERFQLEYTGEDNQAHRPLMLHRAILGSLERFIGIYLEHTSGRMPTWLAPTQVIIMNVTTQSERYGHSLLKDLVAQGVRAEFDHRGEKLGYKIREAQSRKIPYMLVIGEQEANQSTVTVRLPDGSNINGVAWSDFLLKLTTEIKTRSLEPSFSKGLSKESNQEVHH